MVEDLPPPMEKAEVVKEAKVAVKKPVEKPAAKLIEKKVAAVKPLPPVPVEAPVSRYTLKVGSFSSLKEAELIKLCKVFKKVAL